MIPYTDKDLELNFYKGCLKEELQRGTEYLRKSESSFKRGVLIGIAGLLYLEFCIYIFVAY